MKAGAITYREAIQFIYEELERLYDYAGYLRDHAASDEKEYWNTFRGNISGVTMPMRKLDNSLTDDRAKYPVDPIPVSK